MGIRDFINQKSPKDWITVGLLSIFVGLLLFVLSFFSFLKGLYFWVIPANWLFMIVGLLVLAFGIFITVYVALGRRQSPQSFIPKEKIEIIEKRTELERLEEELNKTQNEDTTENKTGVDTAEEKEGQVEFE